MLGRSLDIALHQLIVCDLRALACHEALKPEAFSGGDALAEGDQRGRAVPQPRELVCTVKHVEHWVYPGQGFADRPRETDCMKEARNK